MSKWRALLALVVLYAGYVLIVIMLLRLLAWIC